MFLTVPNALLCILVPIVCYFVAKLAFKRDTKIEDRRRAAAKLALVLKEQGLRRVPDFLIDYSVGDYSGMVSHMQNLSELFLSGEAAVIEEFQEVFSRVLEQKLKNPEARAYIAARLSEATPAGQTKPSVTASVQAPGAVQVVGQTS